MENILLAAGVILAYLAGSIPSAVWVGKMFYGIDVRTKGSGNAGATNTIRVLGLKAGLPVMVFDVVKGWFAVYLANFFSPSGFTDGELVIYQIALAAAAVFGHVFPVFAGFRGGKGIATLLGVGIALYPQAVMVTLAVFITVFLISKIVSLSSITASLCFPFIVIFIFSEPSVPLIILAVCVGIFVPLTHRKNIHRLNSGTESKFSFRKKTG